MGLLNPLLLMLAGAAAVPLLLHLFQRHQGPRVVFPALRYLRRAEKESARRIRIRQLLLMLLRILAMLLIAFAAARPFVRLGGVGHAPTAVVLIIDNSLSSSAVMGDRRVIDDIKERALDMLGDAAPDDRFWLLRAGNAGEPALAGDAASTMTLVRETEPAATASDIGAAIEHARALLAAGAEGRAAEIQVLTDLQVNSFRAPLASGSNAPPVIVWHPSDAPPQNRSITDVQLGGGMAPVENQRTVASAAVSGTGTTPINVRLTVDGRLAAAASARPGESAVLALPPRGAGIVEGTVDIDADAMHADDRRFFVARVLPPPTVQITSDAPFIADALAVLAEAGRIRMSSGNADVLISPAATGPIAQGRGAVVVLPPTSPNELAAVNGRLAAAGIPWRYGAPVPGEARFAPGANDPLLTALESARMRVTYTLTAEGAVTDSALLRLSDGTPWAVHGERRVGGTYVLLGSPLSVEASTLPTSAAMIPLLDRLISAWAPSLPPRTEIAPGSEISLPAGTTAVQRPDETKDDVAGAAAYHFGTLPGIYRILRDDSLIAAYAMNAPASESDLTRLKERDLDELLPGWSLHVTDDAGSWRRAAFRERLGRELWRPLLLALLLVLLVETSIAAAGRPRRGTAGARVPDTEAG